MIEANEIFLEFDPRIALWCNLSGDTNELADLANSILENKIHLISVVPEVVSFIWTCLEKENVKILARYNFNSIQKNVDKYISDLSEQINSVWKHGANGVQIFIKKKDIENFVDTFVFVKNDLFFEHDLCIGMDINEICISDWENVFAKLRAIRANSLCLALNEDAGNRSDFVGRVYGMLQKWDFDGQIYFALGNDYDRIDQAIRLIESEKPELSNRVRFFLDY